MTMPRNLFFLIVVMVVIASITATHGYWSSRYESDLDKQVMEIRFDYVEYEIDGNRTFDRNSTEMKVDEYVRGDYNHISVYDINEHIMTYISRKENVKPSQVTIVDYKIEEIRIKVGEK